MKKNLLMKNLKVISVLTLLAGTTQTINAQQNALSFDGTNDYIQTDYPGVLGSTARTVEAWVKLPVNTSGENLVTTWGSDDVNGGRFTVRINNVSGSYKLRIENKGGGINGTATLNDGNWHHIAVTYDNSLTSNKYKLYVDGNLDAQGSITTATNTIALTNMIIGRRINAGLGGFFNGSIDEVRVWDKALTLAEIQANKNLELCTPLANLKAYFKMNEGVADGNNTAVTTITSADNAYTGILNTFALTGTSSNFAAGPSSVTAVDINSSVTQNGATLTAAQNGATYDWINCAGNVSTGVTTQSFTPTVPGNYAVKITMAGCTETSTCQNVTLGLSEINEEANITVSPNPAVNVLNLKAKSAIEKVEVYNLAGQSLVTEKPNQKEVDLNVSRLKTGVYMVKVYFGNQSKVYKIIKK